MDNIAAIATPSGIGAIALIRLSGKTVIEEFNKIFKGSDLTKKDKNTFTYGKIIDKSGNVVDDVIAMVYHAPNSFTGENSVEITTHGGFFIPEKVLETIILNTNIRKAEPGEFSKRAYLNGKLDLIQAEAIMTLISAQSDIELKIARSALSLKTSNKVQKIADKLLHLTSTLEYEIDYPDDDAGIKPLTKENLITELTSINKSLNIAINDANSARLVTSGIKIAIVGKPNVGKSSLLNALLKEKRAIVSDIPGTTRDLITQDFLINGIKVKLIDTAGIRKTSDTIEKIGVSLSKKTIKLADIVIVVLEGNKKLSEDDYTLLKLTNKIPRIVCLNKTDLKVLEENKKLKLENIIEISSLKRKGIKQLEDKILEILNIDTTPKNDYAYLFTGRQITSLKVIVQDINNIIKELKTNITSDLAQILIQKTYTNLLEIIGLRYNNDIESYIFKSFCVGK